MDAFEKRISEIKSMSKEEFEAWTASIADQVHSYSGINPPPGARFLGFKRRTYSNGKTDVFAYYMTPDWEFYYETDSSLKYKKEMRRVHLLLLGAKLN